MADRTQADGDAGAGAFAACPRCSVSALCRFQLRDRAARGTTASARVIKRLRRLRRGEYLFRAGDPVHSICAICSGSLKSSIVSADGNLQVAGFHIAGELIGIHGLDRKQHAYDAVALEEAVVCEILFQQIQDLCEVEPTLMRQILRLMAEQLGQTRSLLAPFVGRKTAGERLAAYLLCLSQRFSERGFSETEFSLAMSRSDIGNYLGLAKETVSRLCARFQDEGLISFSGAQLRILDRTRLGALARGELSM